MGKVKTSLDESGHPRGGAAPRLKAEDGTLGSISIAYQAPPVTLDPAVAWDVTDARLVYAIFEGLFRYASSPGNAGLELLPCLATELPTTANGGIGDGGCTYTISLRPGVRFQPPVSREMTADDVKSSFERMMDRRATPDAPGTYFYAAIRGVAEFRAGKASHISGFEVVDERTIRIRLERPDPSLLHLLAMGFCSVVPAEWVGRWGREFGHHPLGTGPFLLESWTANREIVLARNPDYREPGKPRLERIRFVFNHAPATALTLLEGGQIDVLGDGVPPAEVARLKSDPAWRGRLHSHTEMSTEYLFINVQMRPFTDVRVRQAVSWAIDRDKLVRVLAGNAVPLYQLFPPGLPGHDRSARYYGHDPARARRLLDEAGLSAGFNTSLYTDNRSPNPELMAAVRDDLAAVGIRAELKLMAANSYSVLQSTPRTLEMGMFGWYMDFPDPVDWIAPVFGRADGSAPSVNSSFWSPPRLHEMLREAQATISSRERLAKFGAIQAFIMGEAPYATLCTMVHTTTCSPRVGGFFQHPVHDIDAAAFWVT